MSLVTEGTYSIVGTTLAGRDGTRMSVNVTAAVVGDVVAGTADFAGVKDVDFVAPIDRVEVDGDVVTFTTKEAWVSDLRTAVPRKPLTIKRYKGVGVFKLTPLSCEITISGGTPVMQYSSPWSGVPRFLSTTSDIA